MAFPEVTEARATEDLVGRQQAKTGWIMKNLKQWVVAAGVGFVLALGGSTAQSQQTTNQSSRGPDWQNMDGQQIQQFFQRRMNEMFRERLEVTDDAEWKIIEERLGRVTQARWAMFAEGAGTMGMGNMGFGGRGGAGGGGEGPGGGRGFAGMFGQPSAEARALQQTIDAKAPASEIKAKLAKLQELRKQKQADLVKAQDDLRKLLTPRQEAIATLMALLD
jgi:Spy/CpxP family protein refolding chaperone